MFYVPIVQQLNICLVRSFVSFREAGKYFNTSHSNISRYVKSGQLISRTDGKYKLTSAAAILY